MLHNKKILYIFKQNNSIKYGIIFFVSTFVFGSVFLYFLVKLKYPININSISMFLFCLKYATNLYFFQLFVLIYVCI